MKNTAYIYLRSNLELTLEALNNKQFLSAYGVDVKHIDSMLYTLAIAHYFLLKSRHDMRLFNIPGDRPGRFTSSVVMWGAIVLNTAVAQAQIYGVAYFLRGQVVLELFSVFALLSYLLRGNCPFRSTGPASDNYWAYAYCNSRLKVKAGHEVKLHHSLGKKLILIVGSEHLVGDVVSSYPRLKFVRGSSCVGICVV